MPDAKVEVVVGDISEVEVGREAVRRAVEVFGRVDVVLANQFVQVRTVGSASCFICCDGRWLNWTMQSSRRKKRLK